MKKDNRKTPNICRSCRHAKWKHDSGGCYHVSFPQGELEQCSCVRFIQMNRKNTEGRG